ncbi:hypothetical protein [Pseudomonas batumici]|uniref:Uncharacterized protein n=1 Tax=Pseudomonas batumici TaxID=226910 RepID=A0A0C2EVU8_9PSED|nr:hypothetical protein [Pseudomonas batumici]KIH82868.1 hypothetical protein UCMB321_3323 [Pseudomonas batumici]
MCDWGLPFGRKDILKAIDVQVDGYCTSAGRTGTLLYPGSGDDIANPLFAAASRIETFVFVDNWQGPGAQAPTYEIANSLRGKFPDSATPEEIAPAELARDLGITMQCPMLAYRFTFDGSTKRLLFLRTSLEVFLAGNDDFKCHVFFVKDLAGTDSSVSYQSALPHVFPQGLLISNALNDYDVPFLPLFGLRHRLTSAVVGFGEMIVAHKVQELDCSGLVLKQLLVNDLQMSAAAFFSDYDDEHDFLSSSYEDIRPKEVDLLAVAMGQVLDILKGALALEPQEQFEICRACVQKQSWVGAWKYDSANYEGAWQRLNTLRYTRILLSRPSPSGRRKPRSRPIFKQ